MTVGFDGKHSGCRGEGFEGGERKDEDVGVGKREEESKGEPVRDGEGESGKGEGPMPGQVREWGEEGCEPKLGPVKTLE